MDWDRWDYFVAGTLLASASGTIVLGAKLSRNTAYRKAVGIAVVTAFVIVWANLAVGIIGNEDHPANRLFFVVLAFGAVCALLARLRSRGLARAMLATAVAQASLPLVTWAMGWGLQAPVATAVFTAMWFAAASLFRKAARQEP